MKYSNPYIVPDLQHIEFKYNFLILYSDIKLLLCAGPG